MVDVQGSDLPAREKYFTKLSFLGKLLLAKKRPKLGIQLPNARYDNKSYHKLTVIYNLIKNLWIM